MDLTNKIITFGCNTLNHLGLVRSLGEVGIRPYCIFTGLDKGLVVSSKYPILKQHVNTPEEGLKYIIEKFSKESIKPILFSSDDHTETLLDMSATYLSKFFIIPVADEDGKITNLMEKLNIGLVAQKLGFLIPHTLVVGKDLLIPDSVIYPCFTKSIKSIDGGKKEQRICKNEDELKQAINEFTSDSFLVQQYIEKIDEFCLVGFSTGNDIFMPYIRHLYRFTDEAFGGYAYLEKIKDISFYEQIKKLILSTSYKGLFSVEFILGKDKKLYFTEINFRHDGCAYYSTAAGANLPYLYCESILSGKINTDNLVLREKLVGMNESVDFAQFVVTGKISPFKWLYQCVTADSHILYNKHDIKPFLYDVYTMCKIGLKKIMRIR